jgi:hypothetical protein
MQKIPVAVVWLAVLCGYLPYQMGFAFFNPVLILAYAFLGLLVGASLLPAGPNMRNVWISAGIVWGTLAVALLVVNLAVEAKEPVLPEWGVLGTAAAVTLASVLLMQGLAQWLLRKSWDPSRVRLTLRLSFAVLATAVYFNGRLPYDWKIWLSEHTTDEDLIRFGLGTSALFVGIWRLTSKSQQ